MKNSNILAVDAMGGDFGPSVVVPGALKAGQKCGAKILLVGIESAIQEVLDTLPDDLKTVDFPLSMLRRLWICMKTIGYFTSEERFFHSSRLQAC